MHRVKNSASYALTIPGFFEVKPIPNPGVTVLQLVSFGGEAFELLEGAPSDLEPLRDTFAQRLELLRTRLGSA